MIYHRVKFKSALSPDALWEVGHRREPEYRRTPGLMQKFYIDMGNDTYCGCMIWESREALAAFQQTELARSVPEAYKVVGAPEVEIGEVEFLLRESVLVAA